MTASIPPCPALLADRFKTLHYDEGSGTVVLLDRRSYPFRTEYVTCRSVNETAVAIEQMVVQGGPPLAYAAGLGLALAAHPGGVDAHVLRDAAARLLATRPTADDLHHLVPEALRRGEAALADGADVRRAILDYVNGEIARGNRVSQACGAHAATLLRDGDRILTHCLAGAALCWMLWIAKQQGKQVTLIPTETRPYLQGARLTAQCAVEMGIPVQLITDGMPAHLMSQGRIDTFICAADRITLDGHITNKVGTLHNAIAANYFGIPFYVLGYDGPDPQTATAREIQIEERNPQEVFFARGREGAVRTAVEGIDGYYPAFDITPPHLIAGIVTDRGVFPATLIARYWDTPPRVDSP